MQKIVAVIACLVLPWVTCGCQGAKTRAGEGAVIGGVLGAAAGGIIGHQSHHGGQGAGIGAAAGGLVGALLGSQIQKPAQPGEPVAQEGQASSAPQAANFGQLPLQQIIDMSKQGVNEAVIIDKIRLSNSKYSLSASDISMLQQQGVSQKVIDEMRGVSGGATL